MSSLPEGRAKLYWLMGLLMADHHDAGTFCTEFCQTYNFEIEEPLTELEKEVFSGLFDKAALYSPFPADRETYKLYQSGTQIRDAVKEARQILGVS